MINSTLIVDCGSTKADWAFLSTNGDLSQFQTPGFNPLFQTSDSIAQMLRSDFSYWTDFTGCDVHFYGAGCMNDKVDNVVSEAISSLFSFNSITVNSDLLAACHALLGNEAGIACILGTGANSCYYDGTSVVSNTHPLGFILGDEGSGAYIGKRLLSDALKGLLPLDLSSQMLQWAGVSYSEIIDRVYRGEYPSRFLASFTRFAVDNLHRDEIHNIVLESFINFIDRNLMQYGAEALKHPINAVGSVAFHFEYIFAEAIEACGLTYGHVTQAPIDGLIDYYSR